MVFFRALIIGVESVVAASLFYYYVMLVAGRRRRRAHGAPEESSTPVRFAVAIPAHNEEAVIGETVSLLHCSAYRPGSFDVHVVTDYCSDATARAARAAGAVVHERSVGLRGRKGYALAWLLERLLEHPARYDAVVVFDADSKVEPDFLSQMAAALLSKGDLVLQGKHVIANPGASAFSALADADMRLNNRIRNQAKENLGLSARLMGDAMCFRREILEAHPFRADSLTEDREYGIQLLAEGVRVGFVPEAVSRGQATTRWRDATGQRLRWYAGVGQLQRRYIGRLLVAALKNRNVDALVMAVELAVLPFSLLSILATSLVLIVIVLPLAIRTGLVAPSLMLAGAALLYPVLGLLAEQAPLSDFLALAYGPVYVAWRAWIGLKAQLLRDKVPWVRTKHAPERG